MSIEGQGHFFTIYFPGFECFVLYWAKLSGERLQDHWVSGIISGPDSLVVRASALGAVGRGFAPRSRHAKGFKNGTSSSLADAHIKRVVLGR